MTPAVSAQSLISGPVDEWAMMRIAGELPDPVVVIDAKGCVRWGNLSAERFFDRSINESIGISGLDLVHPDDIELVLRSLASIQTKTVGSAIDVRVRTYEGWRLVEIVGSPVPWIEEGAVLLCVRDMTDRRRYELATGKEAAFRSIVQNSAAVTMLISENGMIESVSGSLTRLLGHDPEFLMRRPLSEVVSPQNREALAEALDLALLGATAAHPVTIEVGLLRHASIESVPFELVIVNLLDDPTVGGFVVSAHDTTARTLAELKLRNALSLLTATLDSTADGILVVDNAGRITSFNRRFAEMWRIDDSLLDAGQSKEMLDFVQDQVAIPEAFRSKVDEVYSQPESESDDILEFKDGRIFERHSKPQRVEGAVVGRVWSFRDVTDRKRLEDELSYQAFHDPLTGLANKALFMDRLQHAAARLERSDSHLAVLFIDLDNFKNVNDSLGHAAGDEMLRRVAEVIVCCLRKVDTAARIGGDEFAVLVEDLVDHSDALKLAERILTALRMPVSVGNRDVTVTVSIGVTFETPGITSDQLLRNADLAMYTAKERGKNRFEQYRADMHEIALARLEVQSELHKALKEGELIVHYQPIVDLFTGGIIGFEALARWMHPTHGLLGPISFIPYAEESDLISQIDTFVLAEALSQTRKWQIAKYRDDLAISVNVSARRLIDADLAESTALLLEKTQIHPSNLILEITESGVMSDTEIAARNLNTLKELGVRIALDDFGTGYSTLSYLERLPIDIVKIDKSFVDVLKDSRSENALAPAIIQLAQTLGHTPIAEGVETDTQAVQLRRYGCRLAQGYHLGVPQDPQSAVKVLDPDGAPERRPSLARFRG